MSEDEAFCKVDEEFERERQRIDMQWRYTKEHVRACTPPPARTARLRRSRAVPSAHSRALTRAAPPQFEAKTGVTSAAAYFEQLDNRKATHPLVKHAEQARE